MLAAEGSLYMTSSDIEPKERSALIESALHDLPATVREVLEEFLRSLTEVIGPELECVLLFGSAAEGRLRPTSDVDLAVLATKLKETQLSALRAPLKTGRAAVGLTVMFLESAEFSDACESFSMKFADMKVRHRVLYGEDPFAGADIPRDAATLRFSGKLLARSASGRRRTWTRRRGSGVRPGNRPSGPATCGAKLCRETKEWKCQRRGVSASEENVPENGQVVSAAVHLADPR
jgi:predicted nucleotidyltransferase